jgi:alkylation response protein AidB-like acyl-CoA dehydrogenase
LSALEQLIYYEELATARAPEEVNRMAKRILGPVLIRYGSDEQRRRLLPRILSVEDIWCQGYSEPDAGSDLASLRTVAAPTADGFIVNGHKIWTTNAHIATWCFLLARTDPTAAPHKGISFLLVDMTAPGVSVRPIRQLTGGSEFNEVFFDNVFVPAANLVGDLNQGWRIAVDSFAYERSVNVIPRAMKARLQLRALVKDLSEPRTQNRLSDGIGEKVAWAFVESELLRLMTYRSAAEDDPSGMRGSMLKLSWSESHQKILDIGMQCFGPISVSLLGQSSDESPLSQWATLYLEGRWETIGAGTSEIQRNIIAERGLGLLR